MSHLLSKQKNDDIEKQRLKLLYKSSEILSISNIVSALMAYAIVFHHYHLLWIELWVLGVVFLNAAQIALARYFFKISENDFDVLKYEYIFIAVAILNGILWGALGASFSQEWSILDQILIFVIFVSIISISFQSYSILFPLFHLFSVLIVLPMFFQFFKLYYEEHFIFLLLLFLFHAFLIYISSYTYYKFIMDFLHKNLKVKSLMKEVQEKERQKRFVLEGANLGFWDWYPNENKHDVNKRWLSMLGLTQEDMQNNEDDWKSRIHPEDLLHTMYTISEAVANNLPYTVEFRMRHKDGSYVWIQGSGAVVERDENGKPLRLSGIHQDISEKKTLEFDFEKNRIYMRTLFDLNPNMIVVTNPEGIIDANHTFFSFFDTYSDIEEFKKEHKCICDFFEYIPQEQYLHPKKGDWIVEASKSNTKQVMMKKGEEEHYFSVVSKKITFSDQDIYIITFADITELHQLKEQLKNMATIDELTQVYNRRYFNETAIKMHANAKRSETTLGFMMIDIDNFKHYNDHYGHDAGDEVLKQVATLIKSKINRANDLFSRLGGEEFAILAEGVDKENFCSYAQIICNAVADAKIEHKYNANFGIVTISIGVSVGTIDRKNPPTLEALYKIADNALYDSKESGRNQVTFRSE